MKVIINSSSVPFQISQKGFQELIKLGWESTNWDNQGKLINQNALISFHDGLYAFTYRAAYSKELRTHPDLIKVVLTLGNEINENGLNIKVIDIPEDVDWELLNWNGPYEVIREKSRMWH